MKKYLLTFAILLALAGTPLFAKAYTISELQELVARYTALLNEALAKTPQNPSARHNNQATLKLSYDSKKKESSLVATQEFSVSAGHKDLYINNAIFKINRKDTSDVNDYGWLPKNTKNQLTVIKNAKKVNGGQYDGHWLVKAGQTAVFKLSLTMNPQLMYPGVYTAESVVYSNIDSSYVELKGTSLPSKPVTIIGEKVSITSQVYTKPTITAPVENEVLQVGKTYRIKWNAPGNIDKVTLGYSFGEGSLNWFKNNSANNIPNTGYYDWSVDIGNVANKPVRLYIIGYQTGVGSWSSYSDYFRVNSTTTSLLKSEDLNSLASALSALENLLKNSKNK